MWTPTTRRQHSRIVTRYQTDLTDAEWRVIAPHLPKPTHPRNLRFGHCESHLPFAAIIHCRFPPVGPAIAQAGKKTVLMLLRFMFAISRLLKNLVLERFS